MGRPPRPIDDDLVYHAINRGNNRADVFDDDDDRRAFLDALAKTRERYPFRLLGYCLMTNHFHLLLKPEPGRSISRILQSITVAHTWRYHRRHRSSGHVWQGRFRGPVVQDGDHLLTVLRYIEANPLRAGMVSDPADYPWSSFLQHGLGRPDGLLSPFPEWDDLGATESARRKRWAAKVRAAQKQDELDAIRASLRSGRPYGDAAWGERMAARLGIDPHPRPRGRPPKAMP
ncbi:Transposase IS200 like protein [Aquisphaera giovannonii]|uniref:Transposase IS200 like protein n=1 Tax=Aquisphaera giovannonii TaxID=406548 RepID=A0A5B9WAX9_9BACT|nr:transposase [Aquisphaera giovannonii]QEH37736.1 Transposase IS200 like protein [Aquisphaera giovannonii]